MKKILLAITLLSIAATSSFASGKAAYDTNCASCHGAKGISPAPIWPNLAGQKSAYTVKQLKDFQSNVRKDAVMAAMAGLVKGKEQAIADYLASLK